MIRSMIPRLSPHLPEVEEAVVCVGGIFGINREKELL